jgi:site-specific DNA recombinase
VNEEESKVVKEIFNLYLHKHKSFNAIATELNMRKIPTRNNFSWAGFVVSYILSNPVYMGKVRYSVKDEKRYFEAEGKHEAIIPERIFLEVQVKIAKMKKIMKKRPREENYYCGALMCGVCGRKMTTHNQYSKTGETCYNSYQCTGKRHGCPTGSFGHNKVEIAFREYIEGYEDFAIEPTEIITSQAYDDSEGAAILKAGLETSLNKLIKKERDIMSLYINDKIDYDDYIQMLSLIKAEKKSHEVKIAELENTAALASELIVSDIIENFRDNWELLTNLERMQFLHTYIQAIYIAKEEAQEKPGTKHIKVKRLEFHKR